MRPYADNPRKNNPHQWSRKLDGPEYFDISIIMEYMDATQELGSLEAGRAIRALSALAQEHRLAVFRMLVEAGAQGLAAGVLADRLGIPASSMSFHLAQLAHAGLVTQRRSGRSIIYCAHYGAMNGLMAYLTRNCCGGVPCGEVSAPFSPPSKTAA